MSNFDFDSLTDYKTKARKYVTRRRVMASKVRMDRNNVEVARKCLALIRISRIVVLPTARDLCAPGA
jgi:hypothetical protein